MAEELAATYWMIRSAEVASIAKIAGDEDDRRDLLQIAAIFEAMAERARERDEQTSTKGTRSTDAQFPDL